MWIDLIDIVKIKIRSTEESKRKRLAKPVNALYGSMYNCQVAFNRCKQEQSDESFTNLVLAIDSFIYSLQNLNPELGLFEKDLARRLENYSQGEVRTSLIARPHDYLRGQLKLLRKLVHKELDILEKPMEEFGSFDHALEELGLVIQRSYAMENIFRL